MGNPGTKQVRLQAGLEASARARGPRLQNILPEDLSGRSPEDAYRASVPHAHRKRLAQFFTPSPIAELMLAWIAEIRPQTVLDPAVGPGIFPRLLWQRHPTARITALDVDSCALDAARHFLARRQHIRFVLQDFLTWQDSAQFDAAIANPPYLRHHDFSYPPAVLRGIGARNGLRLSGLSNLYVFFIVEICRRLKPGGRAAILVPGEWVNANFGTALKSFLLERSYLRRLLYFSHAVSQFEDALTTASILFLEKPRTARAASMVRTVSLDEGADLQAATSLWGGKPYAASGAMAQDFTAEELLRHKKWNHLFARHSVAAEAVVVKHGFVPLSVLADARRGIATGANSFFHLKPSTVGQFRLARRSLLRCTGKAKDAQSLIFSGSDFLRLTAGDDRCYLLSISGPPSAKEAAYLRAGEADSIPDRYLCRAHRPHWYSMENRAPSAIWATVFVRRRLRFVLNAAGVHNLTAFHCVYPKVRGRLFAAALAACLNSAVVQDRAQRHLRVYGGGLLKVEPKDVLEIEVPDLRRASLPTLRRLAAKLKTLDVAFRRGCQVADAEAALNFAVRKAAREILGDGN